MDNEIIKKLDSFFSPYPLRQYKKGSILIYAGKEPSGVFYVKEGIIRQYYLLLNGSEITLNLYKPYTFIPAPWILANVQSTHFYEALTDVKVNTASKKKVLTFLKKEPDIIYDLLKRVFIGMEGLWVHLESLTAGNSYSKLIASLVILAKRFGKYNGKGLTIDLKLNEQDIANYTGMSRETASREIQILKKKSLLDYHKGVIILPNLKKLEEELRL